MLSEFYLEAVKASPKFEGLTEERFGSQNVGLTIFFIP